MAEKTTRIFLQRWKQALIKREGSFVWLHLGGVACYEVIPNFVKSVKDKILSHDREIKEKGGLKAVIHHWRTCIDELRHLDDETVLKKREEMLHLLQPEMWHEGLGRAWSFAAESAHVNFSKIRPAVQRWIYKYENRCDLNKPFSGRLTGHVIPSIRQAPGKPSPA